MNKTLIYLMDEICAGVEIYYTGRTGGQYLKTAFILCDDYVELVSKLYLKTDDPNWSDLNRNGHYKNFHDILQDIEHIVSVKKAGQLQRVQDLQAAMTNRRNRRNDFFHSTNLLDLSVSQRNCVESFCDLIEYGEILFSNDWRTTLESCYNLATLEVLLKLERRTFSDPSIQTKINKILQEWPRNISNSCRKGVHLAVHPEDLHLRLCVTCGGKELRDKLKTLLAP